MQVFAELGNGVDGDVGNVAALGQHEISQSWSNGYDLLDCNIRKSRARGKIKNSEVFVNMAVGKVEKGVVVDEVAAGEAKFP